MKKSGTSPDGKTSIRVQTMVSKPVEVVWDLWTAEHHIMHWNHASDAWHTPRAQNDLKAGGRFLYRMEAKDGSMGFDFSGTYEDIELHKYISYEMDDGRRVRIRFEPVPEGTEITEDFEAEYTHSLKQEESGWQAILDNFKRYAEG